MAHYGLDTPVPFPYEEAVVRTHEALKEQGFGVLTEIDVQATLKRKLDVEFRRYLILGACNPQLAYRALQAEPEIGLLLPCNVVVAEQENGSVRVSFLDPQIMAQLTGHPELQEVARQARERLQRAMAALAGGPATPAIDDPR